MPKTRKSELEVTASGAAPAPVRRRAASAPRTGATSRKRPAGEPVDEPEPMVASVTETVFVESVVIEPTHEQIAALAYLYWVDRGCQGGNPEEDWLRAEQELRQCVSTAAVA